MIFRIRLQKPNRLRQQKVTWQMRRCQDASSGIHSKSPHAEDMEEEINLSAPSSASRFSRRGCGRREWRAKCTFAYSRIVPGPLTSHRDAANGVDVLHPTGRPRRRLWQTTSLVVSGWKNGRASDYRKPLLSAEISFTGLIITSRERPCRRSW